jgi:hypothetical protein
VSPVHHPQEGGEQTQEDDVQRQGNQKDPPAWKNFIKKNKTRTGFKIYIFAELWQIMH